MSELQDFTILGDHAEYRPTGECSLFEAIALITSGIELARAQQVGKLMVVTHGLKGFQSPSVTERYYFIHDWAKASGRSIRIAVVAQPEMIDPQKFGETVAANIGFTSEAFSSEEAALAWLRKAW